MALSFCSFQLEYGRWVALGAVFSTEKKEGLAGLGSFARLRATRPESPLLDARRLELNVARNILFGAFWDRG